MTLTLEMMEAFIEKVLHAPPRGPSYVLVPHAVYEAMQQMPGGPSMDNYIRYFQERNK